MQGPRVRKGTERPVSKGRADAFSGNALSTREPSDHLRHHVGFFKQVLGPTRVIVKLRCDGIDTEMAVAGREHLGKVHRPIRDRGNSAHRTRLENG